MRKCQARDGEENRTSTRCKDSHNRYMESVGLKVEDICSIRQDKVEERN